MKYQHFTIEEREAVQEMLWQKASIRTIVKALDRSPLSVSRELSRNRPPEVNRYAPRFAHRRALGSMLYLT
jgi:transposase, IS30 family